MSKSTATMREFIQFHSMKVSPSSAMRCVQSIDGVVLFMPSNYKVRGIAAYHVTILNTVTYYLLVLFSFTGFSTALNKTDFLETSEDLLNGLESPEVTEDIRAFVAEKSNTQVASLKVIRRFSFNFHIPGLRVKMFHLSDGRPDAKLHLVEIYQAPFPKWPLAAVLLPILAAAVATLR